MCLSSVSHIIFLSYCLVMAIARMWLIRFYDISREKGNKSWYPYAILYSFYLWQMKIRWAKIHIQFSLLWPTERKILSVYQMTYTKCTPSWPLRMSVVKKACSKFQQCKFYKGLMCNSNIEKGTVWIRYEACLQSYGLHDTNLARSCQCKHVKIFLASLQHKMHHAETTLRLL